MSKIALYVVATPIGNLGDLSKRAVETLQSVDWIAAEDTRHSKKLLDHYQIQTPLVAYHDHNESQQSTKLIARMLEGQTGALISDAGTPLISDPGYRLIKQAKEAQLIVSPIPGPCACISALSAAGLASDRFSFLGFLPHKSAARVTVLKSIASATMTQIFYESPRRIADCLSDCVDVFGEAREACLARELTKQYEQVITAPLGRLLHEVREGHIEQLGEMVLMISPCPQTGQDKEALAQFLRPLLKVLPVKQAVSVAVELSNYPKNALYEVAVALKSEEQH